MSTDISPSDHVNSLGRTSNDELASPFFVRSQNIHSVFWQDVRTSLPLATGDLVCLVVISAFLGATVSPLPSLWLLASVMLGAFWVFGLYPATFVYPAKELRRVTLASLAFVPILAMTSSTLRDKLLIGLGFASLVGLTFISRLCVRRLCSRQKWWQRPVHVSGNATTFCD